VVCLGAVLVGCGGSHQKSTAPQLLPLLKHDFRQLHRIVTASTKATKGLSGQGYTIVDGPPNSVELSWVPRVASATRTDLAALEAYKAKTPRETRAKPYFVRMFRLGLIEMRDLERLREAPLKRPHHAKKSAVPKPLLRAERLSRLGIRALARGARELGIKPSTLSPVRVPVHVFTGYTLTLR
jgi:hypothetical protein